MSYFPGIPQPDDIPADSQDEFLINYGTLNNVFGVNHIPFGNTVVSATNANPCVITSTNNRLVDGDQVTFYHMYGINSNGIRVIWPDTINGVNFVVTKIVGDDDSFSIPLDTSSYDTYEPSSGNYLVTSSYPYGYHTLINLLQPIANNPNLNSPNSSLFSKQITDIFPRTIIPIPLISNELFFQNNNSSTYQLTNNNLKRNTLSYSFISPWGIIINMFPVISVPSNVSPPIVFNYGIPYTTTNYFTIANYRSKRSSSDDINIITSDLSSFTVSAVPGESFSYISMGK